MMLNGDVDDVEKIGFVSVRVLPFVERNFLFRAVAYRAHPGTPAVFGCFLSHYTRPIVFLELARQMIRLELAKSISSSLKSRIALWDRSSGQDYSRYYIFISSN